MSKLVKVPVLAGSDGRLRLYSEFAFTTGELRDAFNAGVSVVLHCAYVTEEEHERLSYAPGERHNLKLDPSSYNLRTENGDRFPFDIVSPMANIQQLVQKYRKDQTAVGGPTGPLDENAGIPVAE